MFSYLRSCSVSGGGAGVPLQREQAHQALQLQGPMDYVPCPVTHQVCPSGDAGYCQEICLLISN